MKDDIHILIPSYHRPKNNKTVKYFVKMGWQPDKLHVFIDSEADDKADYDFECAKQGVQLHVFDMDEARKRYDYIHRPTPARRAAGQARNMFQDWAQQNGIDFYCVIDDDTQGYGIKFPKHSETRATIDDIRDVFFYIEEFMRRQHIGLFGLMQSGDAIGGAKPRLYIPKVMNTTFYLLPYVYRGERGVQDDDTSMFVGVMNEGYFTGSTGCGLMLHQTPSAKATGGLTDLYNECKLLNKSLVTPIQFPSAIFAEKQVKNGGRLHHHICNKYLFPRVLKVKATDRSNMAWDSFPEDIPFTNEPNRLWQRENQ